MGARAEGVISPRGTNGPSLDAQLEGADGPSRGKFFNPMYWSSERSSRSGTPPAKRSTRSGNTVAGPLSWIHRATSGFSWGSTATSKCIKYETLALHDHRGSAWLGLHGKVYDVTGFIEKHPGGAAALLREAGKDGTAAFEYVEHSEYARERLGDLPCLGRLEHRSGISLHREDGGWQCCLYLLASVLVLALCIYVAGSEEVAARYRASTDWGDFAASFARLFFDAEMWLKLAIGIPGLYLAILGLTMLVGRLLFGIDYTDVPPGQARREIAGNAESLLAYMVAARAIFLLDCWEWGGSAAEIAVAFLLNNVSLAFTFWASHWAWHRWPALYKIVHRKHHLSVKCTPLTTLSDQWLESALTVLLLLVPPALLGPALGPNWAGNAYGWHLNVAWVIVLATLAHSQIPFIPLDHISHHVLPRTNLSFVTLLTPAIQLDFIFGTWKYAHQDGRVRDLYGKIVDRNLVYGNEGCEPPISKALNRCGNRLWRSYADKGGEVQRTQGVLLSRARVSDTLFHLEFQLAQGLRLSAGQHVSLACQNISENQESWNASENHARRDAVVRRSYTPTSTGQLSKVDLLVRHYPPDEQRGYKDGGRASRFLVDVLKVGDRVGLSGPYGQNIYSGDCCFLVSGAAVKARYCVALVAGSGVTPALALLHDLRSEGRSSCMEEYLLLHVVGKGSAALPEAWYSPPAASAAGASRMSCRHIVLASDVQRMTEASLSQLLTQPAHETVALVSGPPRFAGEAASLLRKLGYVNVVET